MLVHEGKKIIQKVTRPRQIFVVGGKKKSKHTFSFSIHLQKANKEASVDNATPQLHALIDKWVSQYDSKSQTTIKQ